MATSGYGNRLAGGNRFFQGPVGPAGPWHAEGPEAASSESSPS